MIVLDTTVLVYAVGREHPLRAPCRDVLEAARRGRVHASTTPEVIQEFVQVRARRHGREEAAALGRDYARGLSPLLVTGEDDLIRGLRIFERNPRLEAFDALLAAVAIERDAEALVSADLAYGGVRGLVHVDPATPALDDLLGGA